MLCDRVLGNLDSPAAAPLRAGKAVDYLDVTWADLHRRALRAVTRGGEAIGVLLPLGQQLRHGDVLRVDDRRVVAVNLLPADLLVGRPGTSMRMGLVAVELGNLHFPVEIGDDEIATLWDGPAEAVFRQFEVAYERVTRRFTPLRSSVLNNVRLAPSFRIDKAPPIR